MASNTVIPVYGSLWESWGRTEMGLILKQSGAGWSIKGGRISKPLLFLDQRAQIQFIIVKWSVLYISFIYQFSFILIKGKSISRYYWRRRYTWQHNYIFCMKSNTDYPLLTMILEKLHNFSDFLFYYEFIGHKNSGLFIKLLWRSNMIKMKNSKTRFSSLTLP